MPFAPGTRLGAYEVTGLIGQGGMGEVYRARDTRLDRTVAIKVVRTDFSERFEREARSISALNHPNICTLHDVGTEDGTPYLVMEFVDGAPIAGPLPAADVVRVGVQICDALEAAHRKGIVHRDLKPANILSTKAGIKLLDFGLAKLQPMVAGAARPGEEATVAALTGAHTIVGTPHYMAPEQIEGRDADARTDIFALGCVLYELITGKRAFDGKTSSNVMAAVLATEPRQISALAPVTPAALEWVVLRCLEKDPDTRWQSARDVALQLKWVGDAHAQPGVTAVRSRRPMLVSAAIGAGLAGLAAVMWIWLARAPARETSPPVNLSVLVPAKVSLANADMRSALTLSLDGRTIAFAGVTETGTAIFLRPLDRFDAVKVEGTDDGTAPFFSADGQWIGFAAGGQLKKVPVAGGVPVRICDAPLLRGSVWLADNTIVFSPTATTGLMRVSSSGGVPAPLTKLDLSKREKTHRSLVALPGGKAVVFVIGSDDIGTYDDARIVAVTLATGEVKEIATGYAPVFSTTGHLLYVRHATVFAVPFDPATLEIGSPAMQILKDVATLPNFGTAEYALSPDGTLVFAPGGDRTNKVEVRWVDRQGKFERIAATERHYFIIDVSPDGRRLALGVGGANNYLMTYDLEQKTEARLTYRFDVQNAIWSHDGSAVTYWTGSDLRSIPVDGSGTENILVDSAQAANREIIPASWSEDGQRLAVTIYSPGKGDAVAVFSLADRKFHEVAATQFEEAAADLSPDGRWLAYISNESGREEVYLRAVDGSGVKIPVSSQGGFLAKWTQQGRELIFGGRAGLMAVPVLPGSPLQLGKPAPLLSGATNDDFRNAIGMAPSPDGKRFAVLFDKLWPALTEIRVITNWAQELAKHWR